MNNWFKVFILLFLVFLLAVPASCQVTVIKTIHLSTTGNQALAYDSGKGEVFVSSGQPYSSIGTISIIHDTDNNIVASIQLTSAQLNKGYSSYCLAYDSGKGEIFVSIAAADTVLVISDTTNLVVANISVGSVPTGIVYDSGKNEVFVANSASGTVSVISDNTNYIIATIPIEGQPHCLAYNSGRGEIYVTSYPSAVSLYGEGNLISVISDSTNKVAATFPVNVALGDQSIVYDSGKGEIFALNLGTDKVSIINGISHSVVATVNLPSNTMTSGIAYDSNIGAIIVGNIVPNSISIISDSTNTIVQTMALPLMPYKILCDEETGKIFVADSSDLVAVLSDGSRSAIPTDAVLPTPTQTLYVDYAVDVYAGSGGNINGIRGHDSYFAYPGSGFTFIITPDVGYQILDVTDNGVSQGAINAYNLPNVQTSHTINATFARITTPTDIQTSTTAPTPSVSELPLIAILPLFASIFCVALTLRYKKLVKKV